MKMTSIENDCPLESKEDLSLKGTFNRTKSNLLLIELIKLIFLTEFTENQDEDPIDFKKLYYIKNKNLPKPIFQVIYESNNSQKDSTNYTQKKRGRKKKGSSKHNINRIHNKFSEDNILGKIQVHFISFIIFFFNCILENLNYKQRFLKLDYQFKNNTRKDFFESLKEKKLSQIICSPISRQYKKKIKYINNSIIYKQIEDKIELKKLFNENYLVFFKNIYYKTDKYIDLKEYGIEKKIFYSEDVKTFKDLIKDNEDNEAFNINNRYVECIKKCVDKFYN